MSLFAQKRLAIALFATFSASLVLPGTSHQSVFAANSKSQIRKQAPARDTPALLKNVQNTYKDVQSLTADFSQKQTSAALGTVKETSGRIQIKRPNMFRWETSEPQKDASLLVGNAQRVWFYRPPASEKEHGQVLIREAADVQSALAMDLLAGRIDVKNQFKYNQLGPDRFELTPLKSAGDIERIELFVERSTNLVYRLLLFTATGNQTELELKHVVFGQKLADSMFTFKTPPKTEEIY